MLILLETMQIKARVLLNAEWVILKGYKKDSDKVCKEVRAE